MGEGYILRLRTTKARAVFNCDASFLRRHLRSLDRIRDILHARRSDDDAVILEFGVWLC